MWSGRLLSAAGAFEVEAELGGDGNLVTERCERLTDEVLAGVRTIDLGRVEERHAVLVGGTDDFDALIRSAAGRSWR